MAVKSCASSLLVADRSVAGKREEIIRAAGRGQFFCERFIESVGTESEKPKTVSQAFCAWETARALDY